MSARAAAALADGPDRLFEEWRSRAECADPRYGAVEFFPDVSDRSMTDDERWELEIAPLLVCRRCPVRGECLTDAFRNGERWGVWGGLTERERERMRNQAAQRRRAQ